MNDGMIARRGEELEYGRQAIRYFVKPDYVGERWDRSVM